MDKSQWQKVRQLFDHVRDKSPSFRTNYLNMVCDGDIDLQKQVERMLTAHDELQVDDRFHSVDDTSHTPATVGNYTIDRELGRGGMGVVYRARHTQFGCVALKVLSVKLLQDSRASRRFSQEATLLAKINHPIVCRIHEAGVDDHYAYIAMDEINGDTLACTIERQPLTLHSAIDITIQLADGLAQAHRVGVTHRDIKPSNVLLDEQGSPHLIDFGIAKFADTRLTATGELMGSPAYMSPEQWRGTDVDRRTDIWSLGILFYEMLTGHPPFRGDTVGAMAKQVLSGTISPLPDHSIDGYWLHDTNRVLINMLQQEMNQRYDSMTEVISALQSLH